MTTAHSKLETHRREAMRHPQEVYGSPDRVVHDPQLTLSEKIAVLEQWLNELEQLQIAVGENMSGPEVAERLSRVVSQLELCRSAADSES